MSAVDQKPVHKIALGIEYDGSKYYGWQRQNEVRSVQKAGESAFSGGKRADQRPVRGAH